MNEGLKALEELEKQPIYDTRHFDNIDLFKTIEKELKALEFVKKCVYIGHSGAIALTDYGFEHKEELKEVLL